MSSAGRERGKEIRKRPAEGAKQQENAKKILNRGNELKDLLAIKDLAYFGAKNELNISSILSANDANSSEKTAFQRKLSGDERLGPWARDLGQRARRWRLVAALPQVVGGLAAGGAASLLLRTSSRAAKGLDALFLCELRSSGGAVCGSVRINLEAGQRPAPSKL